MDLLDVGVVGIDFSVFVEQRQIPHNSGTRRSIAKVAFGIDFREVEIVDIFLDFALLVRFQRLTYSSVFFGLG